MTKNENRKKRIKRIYGTTIQGTEQIALQVHSKAGDIRFSNETTYVYSEISYARQKGPKILSRIPQYGDYVKFNPSLALDNNFDLLCAVDTNSREIYGRVVSVVGIVTFRAVWAGEPRGLKRYWQYNVPFCLEYVQIKAKPENFGWLAAIEHLKFRGYIDDHHTVGMVVDSDLGHIESFNERKQPVCVGDLLPRGVSLIYGSSDVGKEIAANRMLSLADSVSSKCLDALQAGMVPFNDEPSGNPCFTGRRVLIPKQIPFPPLNP